MRRPSGLTFERYLPTLLAFVCTAGLSTLTLLLATAVLNAVAGAWEADLPPLVFLLITGGSLVGSLLLGSLVVPFRRLVIGPTFPFVRWGYLAVAAIPIAYMALADETMFARVFYAALFQIPLAAVALVFVWLGRMFGAFGDDERSQAGSGATGAHTTNGDAA